MAGISGDGIVGFGSRGRGVQVTVQGMGVELAELNGDVPAVVRESLEGEN
jgi:hypothetical protein